MLVCLWPGWSRRCCCCAWPAPQPSIYGGCGVSPAARDEPEPFSGSAGQLRVDNDVVDIAVARIIELAPACDEAQLAVERGEVDRLGRKLILRIPLDSLHAEDEYPAVRQAHPDGISRPQRAQLVEDRWARR